MRTACWAVKGGVGTTTITAALGLTLHRAGHDVLLVDLAGDLPAVLGLCEPIEGGLTDFFADRPARNLTDYEIRLTPGLAVLPRGNATWTSERLGRELHDLLPTDRTVVIDCGVLPTSDRPQGPATAVAARSTQSILVTRACYLAMRHAHADQIPLRPSSAVLVSEPGRALDRTDVEAVLGCPIRAEVPLDPAVARAIDAGLFASRLPRQLERSLRRVA